MVIGLLALMIVMAVAFAIYMRTERVAAGAFRNDVRARQFLHVAMARALADLDTNLGNNPYPDWDIFVSTNGTVDIEGVTNSPALDWIPRAPLLAGISPWPKWVNVASGGLEQGRIGYMIVNCSGLLDANVAGGSSRSLGTNVTEIQLAELVDIVDTNGLISNRIYETVQELNEFAGPAGYVVNPVTNIFSYSYFPSTPRRFIGGPTNNWDAASLIIQSFRDAGLGVDAAWGDLAVNAYRNLLDYVDPDSIPQYLDAGCVEAVPMINEVGVQYEFTLNADRTWLLNLQFQVEYAYPFVDLSTFPFDLNADITFANLAGPSGVPFTPSAQNGITIPLGAILPYAALTLPAAPITLSGGPVAPGAVNVHFQSNLRIRISSGGATNDAVPAGSASPLTLDINMPDVVANGVPVSGERWIECLDPRFNWKPDDANQWVSGENVVSVIPGAAPTFNAINNITAFYLNPGNYAQGANIDTDGDMFMHVANAPLRTVGELGYLCYAPLRTVRLFKHGGAWAPWVSAGDPHPEAAPFHRVLDYFSINKNMMIHGLVNPSSKSAEVLASVFVDMPTKDYDPLPANWARVQSAVASEIASNVMAHGPYTNVSDMGFINWSSYVSGQHNELINEAYIRNSATLLSSRQNLFTILLFAQSTRHVPGMSDVGVVAGAKAIAEVWRDPLVDSDGQHPRWIRLFKVLNSD